MKILDANMILRYLINDNEDMAQYVEDTICNNYVLIVPEVIAEVVYVMRGVYKKERNAIGIGLIEFMKIDNIRSDRKGVIIKGLKLYSETSLDFVDCLLCAYHLEYGYEVCTFDKKLRKLIENNDRNTTVENGGK